MNDRRNNGQELNTVREGAKWRGVDAAGAALGSLGLATFAYLVWKLLAVWNVAGVFTVAVAAWLCVSGALWWLRKNRWGHTPR